MKKILVLLLAAVLVLSACAAPAAAPEVTEADYQAWAEENGYVKAEDVPAPAPAEPAPAPVEPEPVVATASGSAAGYEETITVTVTTTDGVITDVQVESDREDITLGAEAIEKLPAAIVAANSVDVDVIAGATGTSKAIIAAARNAMIELGAPGIDLEAWAEENGYAKLVVDTFTTATLNKAGGVNYGAIEWDEELQLSAIREFLKGGKYLGSPDFAQDETGWNYREMYQMATSFNNVPSNTNLELVLDIDNMHLLGVSEAGTSKTIQFQYNPAVSISWCRQLRLEDEEAGYNYYGSYGVQYDGNVRVYTAADLETEEGQAKLINLFDKYYPTLASNWGAYSATFAQATNEEEVRAGKLAYITNSLSSGAMVIYEVIPTRIVVTAPFLMNMSPSMPNALNYVNAQEGEDKYRYNLGLSDEFIDELIAYKLAYLATAEGKAAVEAYYTTGMFPMLDGLCEQYGMPNSLQIALMETNPAGLKTQTTWIPAE